MKLIGTTQSGSLLMEMSLEEYNVLFPTPEVAHEAKYDLSDARYWAADFCDEFDQLVDFAKGEIQVRTRNAFKRFAINPILKGPDGDLELKQAYPGLYQNSLERYRNSVQLFTHQDRLLCFSEWIQIAPMRELQLKRVRNLGRIGHREIMDAIEKRRLELA